MLIKLSYHILQSYCIVLVKLYYCQGPQYGQNLCGRYGDRIVRVWNVGGGKNFRNPRMAHDNTHLASSTVDIRPIPQSLKYPGRGVGPLSLTSGAKSGIHLTSLNKELG